MKWLQDYLIEQAAAEVSVPDRRGAGAEAGKAVFDAELRALPRERQDRHAACRSPAVGTDAERIDTWNKDNAIAANKVVTEMGIERKGLVEETLDRLQPAVPRRHLAARAVPAQRLGADAARSARTAGRTAQGVLARLRSLRPGERRLRLAGTGGRARRHEHDTSALRQRQRRPRVRHDAAGRREGRLCRVPEDAVTEC